MTSALSAIACGVTNAAATTALGATQNQLGGEVKKGGSSRLPSG